LATYKINKWYHNLETGSSMQTNVSLHIELRISHQTFKSFAYLCVCRSTCKCDWTDVKMPERGWGNIKGENER
jgi:hypothetical protein